MVQQQQALRRGAEAATGELAEELSRQVRERLLWGRDGRGVWANHIPFFGWDRSAFQ